MKPCKRRRHVLTTCRAQAGRLAAGIGLTMLHSAAGMAQAPDSGLEEVVVTGSRIARSTFTTPAPVTVIDSRDLEAVGDTNVGEFLQRVPQTISEVNSSSDVFSLNTPGLQLTSLRNLGSERTLVLVNGRRFVSGVSPSAGYAVDLNAIPTAIIDRIEILTGGTSAVYGSDAVGGVVNIITRTDFEGVEVDAQGYVPQEGDRRRADFSVTAGNDFERGNAWASFAYSDDEGMKGTDREFSQLDLAYYPESFLGPGWKFLGSSFPPGGRFGPFNGDGTPFVQNLADPDAEDGSLFNRAARRDLASPVERRLAAAGVTHEIADGIDFSLELNWSEVNVQTEFEPVPLDLNSDIWRTDRGGTGGLDVASSPLLPDLLRDNLLDAGVTNLNQLDTNTTSRRLTEFGNRGSNVDRSTLRVASAVDFELTDTLSVDVFATWGKTDVEQITSTGINRERARLALDVEEGPDGSLRCVSEAARMSGCAPFDVFGAGTISPEAVDYLRTPQNSNSEIEQLVAGATVLGDTAWTLAGGPVSFAAGYEYREEKGSETPDSAAQSGITTSNRILATSGSYDVNEGFAEIRAPVLDRLALEGAVRVGDYSTVGSLTTWKAGFDADVVDSFRVRGTVSRSVRAPNVADLFSGAGETFATLTDPCNGVEADTGGRIAANCRSVDAIAERIEETGAFTLTQVESQSTGGFNSGNPDVDEETADGFTLGTVWTPERIQGLSLAADWYDIEIDDAITFVSRSDTVRRCFDVAPEEFDPACDGRLLRDTTSGVLIEVNRSPVNEERLLTSGLDLELAYLWDLPRGDLNVRALYNYLDEFEVVALSSGDVNVEDGEVEFPTNRMNLGLTYTLDRLSVDWRMNVIDEVVDSNEPGFENSDVLGDPLPEEANTCDRRVYNDVRVAYDFATSTRAFLGINNVLDESPCILGQLSKHGDVGINTNPSVYDIDGRAFYVGFNARL